MPTKSAVRRPVGAKARIAANHESREALAKTLAAGSAGQAAGGPALSSPEEKYKAVRIARLQIGDVQGGKETLAKWKEIAFACRDAGNTIHNQWLVWHEQAGSYAALTAWLAEARQWHDTDAKDRGPKPKCPVVCMTKECQKHIYAVLTERFPQLNSRTLTLVQNNVQKNLKTRKAANGSLGAWQCVLLGRESLPTSTRPHPIPFDKANSRIDRWEERDGEWHICVRIDRFTVDGRTVATSTVDEFALRTKSRRAASQRAILQRIIDGDYKFCGSSIQFRESDRKWYLLLAYQMPATGPKALDPAVQAILRPAEDHPWLLQADGREIWLGGKGRFVASTRRQLCLQRKSRQEAYRHAGSANKGHGQKRAQAPYFRLTRRWKDFVSTFNHTVTRQAIAIAIEHGCGTVVYEQPKDSARDDKFLATAGKQEGDRDSTGWDWFQVASQLKYKAQSAGVAVEVVKCEGEQEGTGDT